MHILFISDNFPPEVNAPASRTHEHCREWVRLGHKVTVITCAPNFPTGKLMEGYKNKILQKENIDGIEVIRVWSYISANNGIFKRTLDYLSFSISATISALFVKKPDIVVATSPQFFSAVAGYIVGSMKRAPFVFELRDLWPESIKAVGALRQHAILQAIERLELFLYRRAALIISVTHAFRTNLTNRGIEAAKISIVTNGVDIERFSPIAKDANLESRLGLVGRFVVGYIGTHGMAHALETILIAADEARRLPHGDNVRFVFLGDGAEKATLKKRAGELHLDNVQFIDTVSKDEVVRYWSLLDVSIIHLRNTDLFKTVVPSKLFESMGMGIPVALGVAGESATIVNAEGVGKVFKSEDAGALARLLVAWSQQPAELAELKRRCIAAAPRYDRRHLAAAMAGELEMTVEKSRLGA